MSKTRLFIARHGETDYNKNGLLQGRGINAPLNETGIHQAGLLANYLQNYNTDLLISSSLRRAWQTAEFVQKKNGLEILKNSELDEMHFGNFEGLSYADIADEIRQMDESWKNGNVSHEIPGGESPKEVFDRADNAIRTYVEHEKPDTIIIVIHGRLIKILLSEWLGFGLENMHKIEHHNCAVNHLTYQNGGFESVYLNKTDHLADFRSV